MPQRILLVPILLWFVTAFVDAQTPVDSCHAALQLSLGSQFDKGRAKLAYHIPDPSSVSVAWIELWARPKRYRSVQVPVEIDGKILLERPHIPEVDDRPSEISIGMFDAELIGDCIDFGCEKIRPGYVVSETTLGRELGLQIPRPLVKGDAIRIVEGSESTEVVLTGTDLMPTTRILLIEYRSESTPSWVPRVWLKTDLVDLTHVRVTIPKEELNRAAILGTLAVPGDDSDGGFQAAKPYLDSMTQYDRLRQNKYDGLNPGGLDIQSIVVASKDSPVLTSIEPGTIPFPNQELTVTVRGGAFTPKSRVVLWDLQSGLTYGGQPVEFVSSEELHIRWPASQLIHDRYGPSGPMSIWVIQDDRFRVSEKSSIGFTTPKNLKPNPLPAKINSISPYPLPYTDYRSPQQLALIIYGEHFRRDDRIIATIDSKQKKLESLYVSEHEFHAWLPRKLWYSPVVTYRLVIQNAPRRCSVEIDETPEDHQRYRPAS